MGRYAFLDATPFPRPPRTPADWDQVRSHGGREFEAKYYVPILWLALFEPRDQRAEPFLVKPIDDALATLSRRRAQLERFIGDPELVAAFAGVLRDEYTKYALVRMDDLAEGSASFSEGLERALAAIATFETEAPVSPGAFAAL